ncbi:hypothetical protein [Proteus mirabilis]|uniref:hypothetical protein n=1 Tax=Proteus mirabilis TaxID=584 RepID=UPI003F6E5348
MSKIDGTINRIKDQQIGSLTKKVLLVEGSDDELAFGAFLRKKFPSWEQYWVIASTGKKQNVLDILPKNKIGLVLSIEMNGIMLKLRKNKNNYPIYSFFLVFVLRTILFFLMKFGLHYLKIRKIA